MTTAVRTRRLVPSLLALGAGVFAADPTVTILSPTTGAAGDSSTTTVVFKVDWGEDVGGWDPTFAGYDPLANAPASALAPAATAAHLDLLSGATVNHTGGYTSGALSIVVSDASSFYAGQIIKIGSEYLGVSAVSIPTNTLTVTRAEHGSTAASISDAAAISNYDDTTAAVAYAATDTSIDVLDATGLSVGSVITIGSEQMLVTGISSNTLTVKRGYNASTAAAILASQPVTLTSRRLSETATTLYVDSVTGYYVGMIIQVGSERMSVSAVNSTNNTLTVARGYDGTTAGIIIDNAAVTPVNTWMPGDMMVLQADKSVRTTTPGTAVNYGATIGTDGVAITPITRTNVVIASDAADRAPSARSTVFSVPLIGSADQLYLYIPDGAAHALGNRAASGHAGAVDYSSPKLIFQKLAASPKYSYLDVLSPVRTGSDYDGTTNSKPSVNFQINIDDDEKASGLNVLTTTSASVATSATAVAVTSASGISVGTVLIMGSEQMLVTAVAGTNLTVTRAYNGTVMNAGSYTSGTNVYTTQSVVSSSSLTTLRNNVRSSDTTIDVASETGIVANQTVLQIDNEQMLVRVVTGTGTATVLTVDRAYNGTTAAAHTATTAFVYKTPSLINYLIGSSGTWTANVKDGSTVVGTTTFTKKGQVGNLANNTIGRQSVSVPLSTALSAGQHNLVLEIKDGAGQVVAINSVGVDAPKANLVVWDTPTLVVNSKPMGIGSLTQVERSNDLVFTGSRFNNPTQSHKSIVSLKVDGGLPATTNFVSTTLGATLATTATSVTVASATNISVGTVLYIADEQLLVTAVNGTTITVTRGANGTVDPGSSYTSGTAITGTSVNTAGSLSATAINVATTIVSGGMADGTVTTVVVASAAGIDVGSIVVVGTEKMLVTAVNGTTLTVTRGYASSSAVAHANNAPLTVDASNTSFRFDLSKLPVAKKHVLTLTQTYDADDGNDVDATEPQIVQTYYLDTSTALDSLAPAVPAILAPGDGSILTVNKPTVTGQTEPFAKVKLVATPTDGSTAFTLDYPVTADASGLFTITSTEWTAASATLAAGKTYSIQVQAKDAANNESALSDVAYQVTTPTDTVLPTIVPVGSGSNAASTANPRQSTIDSNWYAKAGNIVFRLTAKNFANASFANFYHLNQVSTTLTAGINNSTTTIPVTSGSGIVSGSVIVVGSEKMLVTGGGGTTSLTVTRGYLGTTAAAALSSAVVTGSSGAYSSTVEGLAHGAQISTTLGGSGAIAANLVNLPVASSAGINVGSILTVGSEKMQVTAVTNATTLVVTRGMFGTTAGTPTAGAAITGSAGAYNDFTVTTGASITDVTVSSSGYIDVTVNPGTATSVGLSLTAGQFTVGGYDNLAATAPTITRDTTPPAISLAKLQPTVGNSGTGINNTFQVVLTAGEAIESVIAAGTECVFTAAGTGISNASPTATRVGAATFDATRKNITLNYTFGTLPTVTSGNLTITLTSVPTNFLADYADNKSASYTASSQNKIVDTAGSTCVISSTAATIGKTAPINFLFTFNEPVIDFDKTKILITNGVLQSITGTGALYTAQVMPGEGPTAVKVEFAAGATVKDAVGNTSSDLSVAGGSGISWLSRTYDTTPPRVVSFTSSTPAPTSTDGKPTSKTSIPCSIVFSESLAVASPLTSSAFVVDGGTISGLAGSGSAYTFNIDVTNPSTETEKKIRCVLQAGKVKDSADNTNSAVAVLVRNFDQKVPALTFDTPTLGGSDGATATSTAKFVINVDGTSAFYSTGDVFLSKVDVTKLGVSSGTISSVVVKRASGATLTDDSYPVATIEVNVSDVRRSPGSVITLSVQSGVVKDRAGNSSASTTKDLIIPGAG